MLSQNYIYISLILAFLGYGDYIVKSYKGITKPNRISWSIWSLAAFITFISQRKLGVGIVSLYSAMQFILPLIIFIVSFKNKKAYWKLSYYDFICGFLAITGLIFLIFTKQPLVSLWLGILTDFFASIPTLIKCYIAPETESWKTYSLAIASSLVAVLTVKPWKFDQYSFAFYVMLINVVFVILILRPQKKKS
jgi:hypothetical protein